MAKFNFSALLGGRRAAAPTRASEEEEREDQVEEDQEEEEEAGDSETAEEDEDGQEAEEEQKEGGTAASARKAERTRCQAIIEAGIKAGNIGLAGHLAFNTSLPASAARGAIKAAGAGGGTSVGSRLDRAMAAVPQPELGPGDADPSANAGAAVQKSWSRAFGRFAPSGSDR